MINLSRDDPETLGDFLRKSPRADSSIMGDHGIRGCQQAMHTKSGFTLVELLVVVAILATLSTIATMNFLDAQVRSKVAVVKSDLRLLTGALEAYHVEFRMYPPAKGYSPLPNTPFITPVSGRVRQLTTPVAYISSIPRDPFPAREAWYVDDLDALDTYDYVDADAVPTRGSGLTSGGAWRISSAGPDLYQAYGGRPVSNLDCNEKGVDYDPTNGLRSTGDIVAVGPYHNKYGDPLDPSNPNRPGIVRVPRYIEQWR
ncbi:MAG: type II secretion system GspH family protein [Candidatus Sumerlaeaceae bacterium]|nr:type II secretion system GspH family protein [Candidatus Sumerlaeaceae bacterium]